MKKILIITKKGKVIKFDPDEVRETKRGGKGVKAIKLNKGDGVRAVTMVDVKKY